MQESMQTAFLVGLQPQRVKDGWTAAESLDELERLVDTAGAQVLGCEIQARSTPDRNTYIGKGKAEEIEILRSELGCQMVVFDTELSPVQLRNLEELIQCPVLDRTTIILDIFAQRARTREARLQVEMAQLSFRLPRLTGRHEALSRLGGGIGTRGPGETKLEVDRRRIRERVAGLKVELEEFRAHRGRLRHDRGASAIPVVALTGYTNAGKSTLHRALAGSDVLVEDRLFATLDATTRRVEHADGEPFLLVDTVGFIHNLPTFLVAAFRSTLEEVGEADLLLHVVDASHLKREEQMQTVHQVLTELKAADKPTLIVYNKCDAVDLGDLDHLLRHTPNSVAVAAATGHNLEGLLKEVQEALSSRRVVLDVVVPYQKSAWTAWVHDRGRVLATDHKEDGTHLRVELEKGLAAKLLSGLGKV